MASATVEQQNSSNAPSAPRSGRNRRGPGEGGANRGPGESGGNRGANPGRRGGRGGGDGGAATGGRAGQPRKARGIGRGDGGDSSDSAQVLQSAPGANGKNVMRVAPPAPSSSIVVAKPDAEDAASDSESNICFICADPVRYSAVPPCNHQTCHICSLRMRALYKSKACTHCRAESEFVIFTKDPEKRFESFKDTDIIAKNSALGIKYEDQEICDDATLLLRYNCPEETCDRACLGWPDLHRHVKHEHNRVLCDLCTRNKKVFTHEHELFTPAELRRHERQGDDVPGSENQSGFKGHPDCGFCKPKRFYSADELYEHCRDKHERCHICDRRSGGNPQYYENYTTLDAHFNDAHFACQDTECLEKKFVVFETKVDLNAHILEMHPNGLSKGARRDARRIDMSQFDDRSYQQPSRGGDSRRRGRGGRDATRGRQESDDVPIRTEQNLTRAEIAYHRTQALVQSSQSLTSRTFGGQLSSEPVRSPPPPLPAAAPQVEHPQRIPGYVPGNIPVTPTVSFPPLSSRPTPRPSPPAQAELNSVEARRLRHASVIERASNMLRNDGPKMELFRADISKYRTGAISGNNLVDMLWSLFDVNATELGTLIKEVADLYEEEPKRKDLLKSWNNWKAINEDYPPIAGASSQSAPAASSAGRVLKLKSSTARSSRSTTARETSWGTAAVSPASSPSSFPTLAQANPNRVGKGAVSATPWTAPQAAPKPQALSSSSSSGSSVMRVVTKKGGATGDEFPSLPAKRQIAGWTPVQSKSRWDQTAAPSNPWAAEGGEQQVQDDGGEGSSGAQRKKKGKQKQMLFHVGL